MNRSAEDQREQEKRVVAAGRGGSVQVLDLNPPIKIVKKQLKSMKKQKRLPKIKVKKSGNSKASNLS